MKIFLKHYFFGLCIFKGEDKLYNHLIFRKFVLLFLVHQLYVIINTNKRIKNFNGTTNEFSA